MSPKKLRVVAEVVRGMEAEEALKFLKFAPKK
ncbi:MAG: uL22 family ribosomal protein [Candidatus Peribacteria bacterium]|nr:uL22 family ribosomal protein [Candidatus Peribacteria bacterium]